MDGGQVSLATVVKFGMTMSEALTRRPPMRSSTGHD
jgi:hypothetical protein